MPNFICTTCGTQHAESDQPPGACAVCQDERQYVKVTGQQWTTLERLRLTNRNSIRFEEPGLTGIGIDPPFAIGQRALFLRTPAANVLWDCIPLLDEAVVEMIKALGGVSGKTGRRRSGGQQSATCGPSGSEGPPGAGRRSMSDFTKSPIQSGQAGLPSTLSPSSVPP